MSEQPALFRWSIGLLALERVSLFIKKVSCSKFSDRPTEAVSKTSLSSAAQLDLLVVAPNHPSQDYFPAPELVNMDKS